MLTREYDKHLLVNACQTYHSGVTDSLGCPYWLHPYRVASDGKETSFRYDFRIDPEHVFIVGLFHDVIEDCFDVSLEELGSNFDHNPDIMFDLLLLTKPSVVQKRGLHNTPEITDAQRTILLKSWSANTYNTYEGWVESIIEFSPSAVAPLIKYCDNKDNSLAWRSKRLFGINKKYEVSKKILKEHLLSKIETDDPAAIEIFEVMGQ